MHYPHLTNQTLTPITIARQRLKRKTLTQQRKYLTPR